MGSAADCLGGGHRDGRRVLPKGGSTGLANPLHFGDSHVSETHTFDEQAEEEEEANSSDHGDDPEDSNDSPGGPARSRNPPPAVLAVPPPDGPPRSTEATIDSTAEHMSDTLDPADPLASATASSAAALDNPFSVESDDVTFNLSAAGRCLRDTRRAVESMRERNRHHRPGNDRSRSRSRSRPRDGEDRPGVHKTCVYTLR